MSNSPSFEQVVQVLQSDGRRGLDGFGAGHFVSLNTQERVRILDLAVARVPNGNYDESAMQALGKVDLPEARVLLERKLADAPNDVCRAVSLGVLLDASADVRYEHALIALLDHDDWHVREKALGYLLRTDRIPDAILLNSALERRLLEEPREDLRGIVANELVYRRGVVPRGRVDRLLLAWTDRLASADRGQREQALRDLRSVPPHGA